MKKILFWLLTLVWLCCSFSSAENLNISLQQVGWSSWTWSLTLDNNSIYCFYASFNNSSRSVLINFQWYNDKLPVSSTNVLCFSVWNSDNILEYEYVWWSYVNMFYYKVYSLGGCNYSWYVLESDITQNYCTNKFSNLIDESDITQSYCEVEFGLIDPDNCPSSWWTGDILWSSFWVNDRQIEGASNIYLYMPDFLSWDYTYLNSGATLQIDVDNEGDEDYINDLLTIETYHPSSDEFAVSFVGYLTLLMPYIIVTLFIVFVWKLIKKIFK